MSRDYDFIFRPVPKHIFEKMRVLVGIQLRTVCSPMQVAGPEPFGLVVLGTEQRGDAMLCVGL